MAKGELLRRLIAKEAARLKYEEGVTEYRDAKRKAARKFGSGKALSLGSHLPTNAEIHAEFQRLIGMHGTEIPPGQLIRLRLLALRQMEILEQFHPYLVGSVLSGAVTEKSDIDLHLFAESCEQVEVYLAEQEIEFEQEVVTIRHGGEFYEFPHIYLNESETVVECTVYPLEDIHRIPKSSITGRAMERADAKKLKKLIAEMVQVLPAK